MARSAKADLQKAKEAKQKKIAIVGFVIFLAVAGFQVPRTMKLLKGADEAAAVSTPPAATTTPATPTDGGLALPPVASGGTATPTSAPPTGGSSSDSGPAPVAGQLVSFTRFASKDPFVQQIDPNETGEAAAGGGKASTSKGGDKDADGSGGSGGSGGSDDTPAVPKTATISVNGVSESVAVGASFPASSPLFQLVKLSSGTAQIGIAGGSYASGEKTSTLRKGKTLVLQNTADGTRFEIRLVAVG